MSGVPTPAPDTPQGDMTPAQQTAAAIAAQAQQRQQISSLADALTPPTQISALVSKATIVSVEWGYPPTVTIQLGGDTTASIAAVRFLDSYVPTAGDTVIVVKQGSELFVLGQMMDNLAAGANGWQAPTLTTTWNANPTFMPILYRMVYDNGARKIQFQGRVWRNGSNTGTTLFTLPADYRPGVQRAFAVTRENLTGGANALQLQANTDGTVTISGHQLETVGMTSSGGGTTGTTDTNHKHKTSDIGNPGDPVLVGWWTDWVVQSAVGTNGVSHNHSTPNHTHTMTNASFPGWISLDGVEFFL
ncbi:hypothetical protein [Rhodococcus phage REQ1]|uniref:hypothetical protein n=1 Tax=Rhodococcus phage REQ1 TaxID=1109712 RepID=UPI00023EEC73|nr:hypothetical protein RoPhREQ1_gp81 [Rhodococcus phage REQ1]AEV52077.1 hypothetical protein [Rhodococcus phage REQ1]